MDNNGVVSVCFDNYSNRVYDYYVPTYISPEDIQNYAVVEDVFYSHGNFSPYKIVKILDYYPNADEIGHCATKYIAAAMNGNKYRCVRDEKAKMEKFISDLDDYVFDVIDDMSIPDKLSLLALFDDDFVDNCDFIRDYYCD